MQKVILLYDLNNTSVLVRVCIYVMKHCNQKQLGEGKDSFL